MVKTLHIKVTGLVQGVWFRQNTLEQARSLGITGWVRNVDDGSVEILATGEDKFMETFVAWCNHGPRGARVSGVIVSEKEVASFSSFEIRR